VHHTFRSWSVCHDWGGWHQHSVHFPVAETEWIFTMDSMAFNFTHQGLPLVVQQYLIRAYSGRIHLISHDPESTTLV
jgi:hypothetical protein